MYIINVRERCVSPRWRDTAGRYGYHLVITPYLHFPFRRRTWQSERKWNKEREGEKKEKEPDGDKREKNERGKVEEKSARRICRSKTGRTRDKNWLFWYLTHYLLRKSECVCMFYKLVLCDINALRISEIFWKEISAIIRIQ